MPDDILDAAQKTIDNAAGLPPEPPPEPVAPSTPPPTDVVEALLETKNPEPVVLDAAPTPLPTKKKKSNMILGILFLFVFGISAAIGTIYVSKRNSIADTRSEAAMSGRCVQKTYEEVNGIDCDTIECIMYTTSQTACKSNEARFCCTWQNIIPSQPTPTRPPLPPTPIPTPKPTSSTIPLACANVGCSGTSCSVPASLYSGCYVNHWVCDTVKPSGFGCSDTLVSTSRTASFTRNCGTEQIDIECDVCQKPDSDLFVSKRYATNCSPGNTPNPPRPSRTPTQPANPVCLDIRIFKGGTQVTNLTSLRPGDAVVFYVRGSLDTATKARFRVNGAAWTETTTKNQGGGWFISNYTIPEGVPSFVIEGEVFMGGAWR